MLELVKGNDKDVEVLVDHDGIGDPIVTLRDLAKEREDVDDNSMLPAAAAVGGASLYLLYI